MQQHWQRLEQKLDRTSALEAELVRRVIVQPTRRRVNRLAIWPAIDVALCIGGLLLIGSLLVAHWRDWILTAPAIGLAVGLFALLIDSIRQLDLISKLEWSGPVAKIQTSLSSLRLMKVRQFKWVILLSPLVWICGLTVAIRWLYWFTDGRANILEKIDPWWLIGNYVFGVLFVPVGCWAAKFLAQRCQERGWWRSVLDGVSGTSMQSAIADVGRWATLVSLNGKT